MHSPLIRSPASLSLLSLCPCQSLFQRTSELLLEATERKGHLREVSFVIPKLWPVDLWSLYKTPGIKKTRTQTINDADFILKAPGMCVEALSLFFSSSLVSLRALCLCLFFPRSHACSREKTLILSMLVLEINPVFVLFSLSSLLASRLHPRCCTDRRAFLLATRRAQWRRSLTVL